METIKLFIKGFLIGIGKIIPGVSGSMLAISLGVYEKIMSSISNIFKDFKSNSKFLIKVGIGMMFSIILVSKLIAFLLNNYYFPTMMLFIGLIAGGLISVIKLAKNNLSIKNFFLLTIPFVIFLLLDYYTNNVDLNIKINLKNAMLFGMLESITMIVPGISGTAIMMMMGVYEDILRMFSEFEYIFYLLLFMTGIIISTFIISSFITKMLRSHKISCYYLIIGFTVSSMILLLKQTFLIEFTIFELILGIFLLLIGFFVSYKLE